MGTAVAYVRKPDPSLVSCELTHLAREPISYSKALQQHDAYCGALSSLGARVEYLSELPGQADAVFVEDTGFFIGNVAVLGVPGAASRRAETESVAKALADAGREVIRIPLPATFDGGDVLVAGKFIYAGLSSRSNRAALEAIRGIGSRFGFEVRAVPVSRCLHLKTAITHLGGDLFLANGEWVDTGCFSGKVLATAPGEPFGGNSLLLGSKVLFPASCPETGALLRAAGLSVMTVDISELAKAEAGLTCMSLVALV